MRNIKHVLRERWYAWEDAKRMYKRGSVGSRQFQPSIDCCLGSNEKKEFLPAAFQDIDEQDHVLRERWYAWEDAKRMYKRGYRPENFYGLEDVEVDY
jgi:hypothetical protein